MEGRGKNKIVAAILAIVIGSFGIHHFYLGSIMAGVILLLVSLLSCGTIAAVSGIVGLIEGIVLLTMDDAKFDAKYNARTPESMEFVFTGPK